MKIWYVREVVANYRQRLKGLQWKGNLFIAYSLLLLQCLPCLYRHILGAAFNSPASAVLTLWCLLLSFAASVTHWFHQVKLMASISDSSHCFRWRTTPWGLTFQQLLRGQVMQPGSAGEIMFCGVNFTGWEDRRWERANTYIYSSFSPQGTAPGHGVSAHLVQSYHSGVRNWPDPVVKQQPPSHHLTHHLIICFLFLSTSVIPLPSQ